MSKSQPTVSSYNKIRSTIERCRVKNRDTVLLFRSPILEHFFKACCHLNLASIFGKFLCRLYPSAIERIAKEAGTGSIEDHIFCENMCDEIINTSFKDLKETNATFNDFYTDVVRIQIEEELIHMRHIDYDVRNLICDGVGEKIGDLLVTFWALAWCTLPFTGMMMIENISESNLTSKGLSFADLQNTDAVCQDCLSKNLIFEFPGLVDRLGAVIVQPVIYFKN